MVPSAKCPNRIGRTRGNRCARLSRRLSMNIPITDKGTEMSSLTTGVVDDALMLSVWLSRRVHSFRAGPGSTVASSMRSAEPESTSRSDSSVSRGDDTSMSVYIGEGVRSEEHTSELQSLMRISYAVFCLKKKQKTHKQKPN